MSKQGQLKTQRVARVTWAAIAIAFASAAVVLHNLAPRPEQRPLVTVYMEPDCGSCRRWMQHLDARGFRTQVGTEVDALVVRVKGRVPPGFGVSHCAIVEGLYIGGYVPARDIHRALSSPERNSILGLVVPGAPAGAPGIEAALKQPYVVFAMDGNGLLRPWANHNHFVH